MALAYIVDGGLNDQPGTGADLYERFPAVRDLYARVHEWTGLSVGRLLAWELPAQQEFRQVGAIRQAAVVLGLCDVLAEHGVRPDVVGGLSLGGRISACIAGSLSRQGLFELLARLRHAPPPPGPAQGVAALVVPAEADLADLLRGEDLVNGGRLYVAAELGVVGGGRDRMLLLAGYRAALDELAARLPKGTVRIPKDVVAAYHSPLSQYLVDFLDPALTATPFRDPAIPLCSCMTPRPLTTAEQVREEFRLNPVARVSLPQVFAGLEAHEVELALLLGPAQVDLFLESPNVQVVHVESPEHLPEALTAIHDFGVQLSAGGAR
ncbi:ACP S-malonyltransferase [Sphaerisporangium dianthi]|uniref:ACP S-malonyltransferase n=1 Tax=Sphaerisporangium dianthi TaxID=1436120 RepID=A0ABV9CLI7_9ACTN